MKFDTLSRRTAAAAGVTALAAGALVATASTATAAPEATNNYSCTAMTSGGPQTFPVTMTTNAVGIEGFPSFAAGATIPAAIPVTNHFALPSVVVGLFQSSGVDNVTFPDLAADFVGTNVQVGISGPALEEGGVAPTPSAKVSDMTASGTPGFSEFNADGQNKSLTAPKAGDYDIVMPSAFTVLANDAEGTPLTQADCTLTDESANLLHQITLTKNTATISAKAADKTVKKGKAAEVKTTVTNITHQPSGKVMLQNQKGKTLDTEKLSKGGKAVLSTKALPVGKNKLTVVYKGDGYTKPGSAGPVTITVKK